MILTGHLLIHDDSGQCRLQMGAVRLEDGSIVEVDHDDAVRSGDLGGPDCLICPGFIDAHLHLPQFGIIGAHGMPLLKWLQEVTFPAEQAWSDTDVATAQASSAMDQLIACGTTGIAAFASVHHEATRAALKVATTKGIRGLVGQVLMDQYAPAELCRPADQLLDEAARLGSEYPAGQRVAAAISPRFALSCSERLLTGAGTLAAEQNASIQTHLAETPLECEQVRQRFGKPYVDVYRDAGLMTARSLFGHGIHLEQSDLDALAKTQSRVVHCPTANTFLNSGSMDRIALRAASVPMAIGSDIGAGYERSMVRVAREMIHTAARLGAAHPTASEAWYAITAGNADALGWADAGRLRVGAAADVLVIQPSIDWRATGFDPLSRLLFEWDDRWLKQVVLRGQAVYSRP